MFLFSCHRQRKILFALVHIYNYDNKQSIGLSTEIIYW